MVLKFVFFDPKKNNEAWWNRLFDRIPPAEKRDWIIAKGGVNYGAKEVEFVIGFKTGTMVPVQELFNQIVWSFITQQINVDKFYVDGNDVTVELMHR